MPDQCAITAAPPSPAAARVLEVSEEGANLLVLLFPQLAGVRVHRLEDNGSAIVISASCTASSECCPACGSVSARVHGGYSRTVADGAAGGRPVLILLRVLRFRCVNPSCPKATFAMQSDGLTSRYCRRSVPLTRMLTGFGLELAGRAGARLAGTLGVPVHSPTVLRLVMALSDLAVTAAPRVTGVDDFALRKGHVYGTVVADAESGTVTGLLPDGEAGGEDAPAVPGGSPDGPERQLAKRTRERYAEIRQRLEAGQPEAAVRRATGLDRRTVQKYARAGSTDELVATMSRESKPGEFKPYICRRWNQGVTEASQIHAELRQRGWAGSPQTVRRYVHLLRKTAGPVTPAPAVPKTREITRWLLSRPGSLGDDQQARLAAVRAGCPHLDALVSHSRDFAEMMTLRQGETALEGWLAKVEADDQPELHSLAAGIRRDQDAVAAGLSLPCNSGAMEGNVNIKVTWNLPG